MSELLLLPCCCEPELTACPDYQWIFDHCPHSVMVHVDGVMLQSGVSGEIVTVTCHQTLMLAEVEPGSGIYIPSEIGSCDNENVTLNVGGFGLFCTHPPQLGYPAWHMCLQFAWSGHGVAARMWHVPLSQAACPIAIFQTEPVLLSPTCVSQPPPFGGFAAPAIVSFGTVWTIAA